MNRYEKYIAEHPEAAKPELEEEEDHGVLFYGINRTPPEPARLTGSWVNGGGGELTLEYIREFIAETARR